MKIKLDENLPESAAAVLERAGHDVDTVVAEGLGGTDDPTVLDVRAYPPGTHGGVLVMRLDHHSPRAIRDAMGRLSES